MAIRLRSIPEHFHGFLPHPHMPFTIVSLPFSSVNPRGFFFVLKYIYLKRRKLSTSAMNRKALTEGKDCKR